MDNTVSTMLEKQADAVREFLERYLNGQLTYAELTLHLANFHVNWERTQGTNYDPL